MKILYSLFALLFSLALLQGHMGSRQGQEGLLNEDKLLWAIKRQEGGTHYGIKGCKENCREICHKTIRHYAKLFKKSKGRGIAGFIYFSSRHYVGNNDPVGQFRWERNVLWLYYKGEEK
jgi:hypothetical protein